MSLASDHTNKHQPAAIPPQIEFLMDTIDGELVCSRCSEVLYASASEVGKSVNHAPLMWKVSAHVCKGQKIKFDFDSPLTMEEQRIESGLQWPKCEKCGRELELIRPHVFEECYCDLKNEPEKTDEKPFKYPTMFG